MELSATDLVSVIKACRENGVATFKTKDIDVTFNGVRGESVLTDFEAPPRTEYNDQTGSYPPGKAEPLTAQEQEEMEDIENANLVLEDPVAWEESQMKGSV